MTKISNLRADNPDNEIEPPDSCYYLDEHCVEPGVICGCMDPEAANYCPECTKSCFKNKCGVNHPLPF